MSLIYIFYVWYVQTRERTFQILVRVSEIFTESFCRSFVLDFLPARNTKDPDNRFPNVRKRDDPNPELTQENGNVQGGPVYTAGGDGHQPQMSETGYYTPPEHSKEF